MRQATPRVPLLEALSSIIKSVIAQIIILFFISAGPESDLKLIQRAVSVVVDSGLNVARLPDSVQVVQDGQKQSYSWIIEDAIVQKLLSRGVRVVKSGNVQLHYRLVSMKIFYRPFRKNILGPRLVERNYYVDATFRLVEGGSVEWIRTFEVTVLDTVPLRMLPNLRYETLSPPVPESRSMLEPIIVVVALGYVLFYLYSGGK